MIVFLQEFGFRQGTKKIYRSDNHRFEIPYPVRKGMKKTYMYRSDNHRFKISNP